MYCELIRNNSDFQRRGFKTYIITSDLGRDVIDLEAGIEDSIDLSITVSRIHGVLVSPREDDSRLASNEALARGVSGHQRREGLEGQVSALREASDELRGKREDLVEAQRCVEGRGEGLLASPGADIGGMAGLDGEDGAGGTQVGFVGDGRGGTEVS